MSDSNNAHRRFVILSISACLTGILSGAVVAWGLWFAWTVTP